MIYLEPLRPIFSTLEKFGQNFRRGPRGRDMSRHKLEVIKLLIIVAVRVKTVIQNVLGPFPNLSRKGSRYIQ